MNLIWGQLAYADVAIDPMIIELGRAHSKAQVKLHNSSEDEYVYRSGIMSRLADGTFKNETKLYLAYPPIGILKSNSNNELGIIKMKEPLHETVGKIYLFIQLIPKKKEKQSEGLVIPLTTTIMVEIKRKE